MRYVKSERTPGPATPKTRIRKRVACVFAALGGLFLLPEVICQLFISRNRFLCFHGLLAGELLLWSEISALLFLFAAFAVGVLPAVRPLFFRIVAAVAATVLFLSAILLCSLPALLVETECHEIVSDDGAHTVVFVVTWFFDDDEDVEAYERENPFIMRRLKAEGNGGTIIIHGAFPTDPSRFQWEADGFSVKIEDRWIRYYYRDVPTETEIVPVATENPEKETAAP